MKKIFTFFSLLFAFSLSYAQLDNGFYRVKNVDTERYLYVCDDKGKAELDGAQVKTDLDAIFLRADLAYAISDPGSIVYVEKHGNDYDFCSQGTSVYDIVKRYLTVNDRSGHFAVGATVSGVSVYLSDQLNNSTDGYGIISTSSSGSKLWDAIPVASSSDNYFGVEPSICSGDKYYAPFYASFAFSPESNSTKVYYVSDVKDCAVLFSEVVDKVAAFTPVIIECLSSSSSNNKLDLVVGGSDISGNYLSGVIFNTDNTNWIDYISKTHKNQKATSSNTRLLSVNSEGKLCFSKTSLASIPANSSYLEVSSSANDELVVFFNKDEYDAYNVSSLEELNSDATKNDIYDLLGKKVLNNESLPVGIYIIGGKKMVVR